MFEVRKNTGVNNFAECMHTRVLLNLTSRFRSCLPQNLKPTTGGEILLSIFVTFAGMFTFSYIVGQIYSIIMSLDASVSAGPLAREDTHLRIWPHNCLKMKMCVCVVAE